MARHCADELAHADSDCAVLLIHQSSVQGCGSLVSRSESLLIALKCAEVVDVILAGEVLVHQEGVVKFERRGIDTAPLPPLLFPPGSCMALSLRMGILRRQAPRRGDQGGGPGVSGEGEAVLQGFTFEGVPLVDGFDHSSQTGHRGGLGGGRGRSGGELRRGRSGARVGFHQPRKRAAVRRG